MNDLLERFPELTPLWEETFENRKEKVGAKKATYSANAAVYAEALKSFLKEKEVRLRKVNFIYEEEPKQYPFYINKNLKVILTRDKNVTKDYPNAKHISEITNNLFEQQVISAVIKDNKLEIDNNFYYIIMERD
jgi:hypothetical protein